VRAGRLVALLVLAGTLAACGSQAPAAREQPSVLEPKGTGARIIADEIWVQFAVGTAIFVLVVALLVGIVVHRVRADPDAETWADERGAQRFVLLGGVALPVVVLTALFAYSVRDLVKLSEAHGESVMTVQVIAHRWWWEVRYPATGIVTANEVVLPVGKTVKVQLRSDDVIHSFWVPELEAKVDMLPGSWSTIWLHATNGGIFRGVCAEFCGLEHGRMQFLVQAMPSARFASWQAEASKPAAAPADPVARRGLAIFTDSTCAYCHTVRGTPAAGESGPDLTHLASRRAIVGAILPNTRGNLAGWIADPQRLKPGALMPRTALTGPDLQALLAYLETLR
jgi:cytochrome c oxidase subunit 2